LAHRVCARTGIHCGRRREQGRIKTVPEWRNWQTRQVQDLVLAREWRFESSFGHQKNQSKGSPNPPASLICSASSSFLPSLIVSRTAFATVRNSVIFLGAVCCTGRASQVGNNVTISYRQAAFARIKDRNKQRIEEFIRKGELKALFNSNPVEILADSVIMAQSKRLPMILCGFSRGGEPPTAFLKKVGIGFGNAT
jgi:hypothetical protein